MSSRPHNQSGHRLERPVVLHVLEAFAGGTERHLVDLVRYVDRFDHVVAIPSRHHGRSTAEAAERLERAGAAVRRVEMGRSRAVHMQLKALRDLRVTITTVDPDIVHGHSSVGGAMARLATWGLAVPNVYTPHAFSRAPFALALERFLSHRVSMLIAVSRSEEEFARARRLAPGGRIVVIPNGIDPVPPLGHTEPLRKLLGLDEGVPIIGSVGRLAWQKAPEVFVSACAMVQRAVPEAHFVLVASGPMRQKVERAVTECRLNSRFHLIPELADAAGAIAEFDVFVLPSRFEGAPYTPLEAMRGGTPVIVTNVAGSRDIVEDGVNGLVVPVDQPRLLANGIIRLLEDPALRLTLTAAARETVSSYGVREMAEATGNVYEELLASAHTSR